MIINKNSKFSIDEWNNCIEISRKGDSCQILEMEIFVEDVEAIDKFVFALTKLKERMIY